MLEGELKFHWDTNVLERLGRREEVDLYSFRQLSGGEVSKYLMYCLAVVSEYLG
jgi:hypothetical protein